MREEAGRRPVFDRGIEWLATIGGVYPLYIWLPCRPILAIHENRPHAPGDSRAIFTGAIVLDWVPLVSHLGRVGGITALSCSGRVNVIFSNDGRPRAVVGHSHDRIVPFWTAKLLRTIPQEHLSLEN